MKSVVNANEFLSALTKATKINKGKHPYLPVLEEIKFMFTGSKCTLISSNLEQWGIIDIPANGDNFSFVSHNIATIVKACKYFDNDLVFDYDQEKNKIQLSSNSKSCEQRCLTIEDYPEIPVVESTYTYKTNAKELLNRYDKIKYAISKEDTRPILTGVCFDKDKIVTMDGYRLAINTNNQLNVNAQFVVPQGMMNLLDIFEKTDIDIEVEKKYVVFKNSDITIISRLLEGEFFDYNSAIPKNVSEEYSINIKQYINELKYLKEFTSSKDNSPVKFDNGMLSLVNAEGRYQAKIDIKGKANTVYGYNLNYMLDGLNQFKDNDNITIKALSPIQPIILTDNKDNLALVFLVRLKDIV